jgi:adenosylcobinamide-GDP ribazoletransferase
MSRMTMRGRPLDGLRFAITLFTVIPVRTNRVIPADGVTGADRVDRETARWAMALAPVIGLIVGGAAALVLLVGGWLGFGSLVSAALAVAAMAAVTRGLHLDGLADLADGLGSGRPAGEALAIMKKSDIGAFGVITLVLTLVIQVAAVAEAPVTGVIVAAVAGRLAVTWACRERVPAARPDGLGHLVAGTIRPRVAVAATAGVVGFAALIGLAAGGPRAALIMSAAAVVGLAVALVVLEHVIRRLGGVTGDVLGALVEIATMTTLLLTIPVD